MKNHIRKNHHACDRRGHNTNFEGNFRAVEEELAQGSRLQWTDNVRNRGVMCLFHQNRPICNQDMAISEREISPIYERPTGEHYSLYGITISS